ncbi:MAG: acyltransferase [Parvularculaceae bacterium]
MGRVVAIQYLRAAAALAVMAFHYIAAARKDAGLESAALVNLGQFGVDIFFVVSGYIMWTTVAAAPSLRPGEFFLRRLIRIVPLYWAATLATALATTEGGFALGYRGDPGDLATSLLFIPAASPGDPAIIAPILAVGWTLNLEMFFYAAFAATLGRTRQLAILGVLLGGLALAGVALTLSGAGAPPMIAAYTQSIVVEFFFGAALGAWRLSRGSERGDPLGGSLMIALGLAAAAAAALAAGGLPYWRGFVWGPPAALIVLGALSLEGLARRHPQRLAVLLGDASYALYLTHGMWLALATALAPAGAPVWMTAIFKIGGAIGLAIGVYLVFERPAGRTLSRFFVSPAPKFGEPLLRAGV